MFLIKQEVCFFFQLAADQFFHLFIPFPKFPPQVAGNAAEYFSHMLGIAAVNAVAAHQLVGVFFAQSQRRHLGYGENLINGVQYRAYL